MKLISLKYYRKKKIVSRLKYGKKQRVEPRVSQKLFRRKPLYLDYFGA